MINRFRKHFRKPMLILIYSFFLGLIFDAMAEQLAAQQDRSRIKRFQPMPIQAHFSVRQEQDDDSSTEETDEKESYQYGTVSDGTELTRPIMDIVLSVTDTQTRKPEDQSFKLQQFSFATNYPSSFQHRIAVWEAPNIRYQPLYFEDVGLERYGYHAGNCLQPLYSAAHFAKSTLLLGRNLCKQNPFECTYPLGFCRPGSMAPQIEPRWLSW